MCRSLDMDMPSPCIEKMYTLCRHPFKVNYTEFYSSTQITYLALVAAPPVL